MCCSSKLADVLRKLHNANDMLQSSAYDTSKPNSPNADEMSLTQLSPTASFASNDDSLREEAEQSCDVQKDVGKVGASSEPDAARECPTVKV